MANDTVKFEIKKWQDSTIDPAQKSGTAEHTFCKNIHAILQYRRGPCAEYFMFYAWCS